jgi:hypothetical protein
MRGHNAKKLLLAPRLQEAFKRLGLTLAENLGGPDYEKTVEIFESRLATPDQVIETVQRLHDEYAKKPDKKECPSQAIMQLPDVARVMLWNDVQKEDELPLVKLGDDEAIPLGLLGNLSKRVIYNRLLDPATDARSQTTFCRLALEVDSMIGGANELHLHQHQDGTVTPEQLRIIAEAVVESRERLEKKADVITVEVVKALPAEATAKPAPPAERPAQAGKKDPEKRTTAAPKSTFEEKQNAWIAFQANLVNPTHEMPRIIVQHEGDYGEY